MAHILGKRGEWEYIIGIEVHTQISSKAKLFSSASSEFSKEPNSQVALVDAGMPGTLPVLNRYCVEQAIKTGLAINGRINKVSIFDRKSYFYADLPHGYQISQFYLPIIQDGYLFIINEKKDEKKIRINRIHLEQDAGKSIHDQYHNFSLIDFNRAGIGLMEIVSEPDISSPYEAVEYIKKLRSILRCIGSSDANMEQGGFRCDVNISVREVGSNLFGTKCEIKNLNSIKNVVKAIEYEGTRQVKILENGKSINQETRLFDENLVKTRVMRLKESSNDYRYFPDPDLLPLHIDDVLIEKLRSELPELPDNKIKRYIKEFGLTQSDAEMIVINEEVAKYFEEASSGVSPKLLLNWICTELFGKLNKNNVNLSNCRITPIMIRELVLLVENSTISGKMAKNIFEEMFETGQKPEEIIKMKGMVQLNDHQILESFINEVIAANSESVLHYKNGKKKLFDFFIGQVMKKTTGKANPKVITDILRLKLEENKD